MNATPAKSAKGKIDSPSVHDRLAPKKRVVMTIMKVGISVPAMACRTTTRSVTSRRNSSMVMPAARSWASKASPPRPPCTPTSTGVPTAPKVTAVLWIIMPIMTAPAAGKPIATMSGAATAAGVPNPAAPSMKDPNSHAMMMIWTRRSSLMLRKLRRIAETPPDCSRVLSSRIAPKMMTSRSKVRNSPCTEDAATRTGATCHAVSATTTAET